MNVSAYLDRIGYTGDVTPNAENLAALVWTHRLRVPYESLDLWLDRRVSLETDALFDKIVTRRRGGYCFELNGLFAQLLRELGYEVQEYAGRWLRDWQPGRPLRRTHRVVCVRLGTDPAQLVDVAIAPAFLQAPLPIVLDQPQALRGRRHRILRDTRLGLVVEALPSNGTWQWLFSFDAAPQLPGDFELANWWCQTHPDSIFHKGFLVFQQTEDGGWKALECKEPRAHVGVLTVKFVVHRGTGEETSTQIVGETALKDVLAASFGIEGWSL